MSLSSYTRLVNGPQENEDLWILNVFTDASERLENSYMRMQKLLNNNKKKTLDGVIQCWAAFFDLILFFLSIFVRYEARDIVEQMWLKQNGDPSHSLTGEVFELKQKQICENNIGKTVETFYFLNILFNFNTQLFPIRWEVLLTNPTLAKFWVENKCTKLFYQNRDGEGSLFIYAFKTLSFPKYIFLHYSLKP